MINTREIAEEYRLSHWAQVLQERTQSGLSIKAFCKQAGICGNTYFYWQRRVRAAACEALTVHQGATEPGKAIVPSGWSVCEVEEPTPGKQALVIEIGGCRISVEGGVEMDPCSEALFVFCNRKRDRIKILEWDTDGFWLYFKRLERGHFRWPGVGADKTMTLTKEELSCLIGSAKLEKKLNRKELPQQCAS